EFLSNDKKLWYHYRSFFVYRLLSKPTTISPKQRTLAIKTIAENRSARHEYFITDEIECGIVLTGTEVKALRQGKIQLAGGFARIDNDELYLENVHISAYEHGNIFNHE